MTLASLFEPVLAIARAAGTDILAVYGRDFDVRKKADASPVTEADLAAHHRILAGLAQLTPHWPVLSEESVDEVDTAERRAWDTYWLIDPLDGTKEFVQRNGEFTVNVALVRAHRPVFGVLHVPVSGVSYYAAEGAGAFKAVPGEPPREIGVARTPRTPRVVSSRSHRDGRLAGFLARLGEHELRLAGSALKFGLIAEGDADVYPRLGPTSEWDTAAGHAIVRAAGGQVLYADGTELRYNARNTLLNPDFLVVGNPTRDWLHGFQGR